MKTNRTSTRPDLGDIVVRRRDAADLAPMRRHLACNLKLREVTTEGGKKHKRVTMLASTSAAVDWGDWREILVHEEGAVDFKAAHALLINHNPNRIAGPLVGIRITAEGLEIEAEIMPDARMESGVSVADAIEAGALRGVSVGYWYRAADTEWDEDTRTLTVRKWRLLENSVTPIPADDDASLRTRSAHFSEIHNHHRAASEPTTKGPDMSFEQWLAARGIDAAKLSDAEKTKARAIYSAGGELPSDFAAHARTIDEGARARDMASQRDAANARAEKAEREAKLRALASEHGVSVADVDFGSFKDEAEGLRALLKRKAATGATTPPEGGVVQVTRDQGDKLLARAKGAAYALGRIAPEGDDKKEIDAVGGARAMSFKVLLRSLARQDGHFDADMWSDMELSSWCRGWFNISTHAGARDASAANKITSGFSTLLANVAHKVLMNGFRSYGAATYQQWTTRRDSPNFLAVSNVGLASGRLTETAEDEAFPELLQKDGGYNSTLGLYGATLSLTFQTIINDRFGAFLDDLRRSGAIAALTIDREVYRVLLNGTWTNDSTASAGLATPANLDKARKDLLGKLSPANEKMGIPARFLLHDPANANPAEVATGRIYGNGQTTAPSQGAKQIVTVESHWIGDTSLYGSTLTTDYFLAGDPSLVDTVLVNFLEGVGDTPIIMPYDAGAVAAEKYKIMLPMRSTLATHVDGAATPATRITGLQRARA